MMINVNVPLPEPLYEWVKTQAMIKHFSSGDYVRELIEQMQKLQLFQQAITEGLESGVSEDSVANIIRQAKAEMKAS